MILHLPQLATNPDRIRSKRKWVAIRAATVAVACVASLPPSAHADEKGISFWLPGLFGSFASVPGSPGWSGTALYYHASVGAGSDAKFQEGKNIVLGLRGQGDLALYGLTYTFAQPVA